MDLVFSEEQEVLRKTAREFVKRHVPKALVKEFEDDPKGFKADFWKSIAELGWIGWAFPMVYGGVGGSFIDIAVLLEEMGRGCVPGPFVSTVILGGFPIMTMGTEAQKQQYLPQIAQGQAVLTLALAETGGQYDAASVRIEAVCDQHAYVINGTKLFVPDAHIADYLLVVTRTSQCNKAEDGITVFIVDAQTPGISHKVSKTIAGDKLCEVVFDHVRVPKENILGGLDQGWGEVQKTIERTAVAKCCEMLGGMQRVFEMSVEYAKERKQFGRPIGSFQAMQHHCSNMETDIESSRLVTYLAATKLTEGLPCRKEVATAKLRVSEAWERVIRSAHQIHAAIGVAAEFDLQYYTRRGIVASLSLGNVDFYRDTVARELDFQ